MPGDRDTPPHSLRLSILVPTRNEAANVEPLLVRIANALPGVPAEVVFVDDSDDDTPERIARAAERSAVPVKLLARPPGGRSGGLGGAVLAGLELASGAWICVLDGDLQHPPELIPVLLRRAESAGADVTMASRLAPGGSLGTLSLARRLLSRALAVVTRALFPERLRGVSDPMTGFFLVRRAALRPALLRPDGFKILLEILVRTPGLVVAEVPLRFETRHAERSKAGARELLRLVRTLAGLSLDANRRLARFLVVGASGFVLNNVGMAALTEAAGFHYLISAVLSTVVTIVFNFVLTELWVFHDRRAAGGGARRLGAYFLLSGGGLVLRIPLLFLLTSVLGLHYLLSNVLSIAILTVLRYALATRWIWRPSPPAGEDRGSIESASL